MKLYNQPTTQVTYVALLKTLMDSPGSVQLPFTEDPSQQSQAMIPARRLYI